jgi:uncharacterized protein YqcC (DUF446 family)
MAMLQKIMLEEKMDEVIHELKRCDYWNVSVPEWVNCFASCQPKKDIDFTSWLQFVYLPNIQQRINRYEIVRNSSIAAQAGKYLGAHPANRRLIQLLVELDSLM